MKYVLVIPDGMGDKPVAALGGKTPLEAAKTPNMDHFASKGVVGVSRTIPDGYVPGTDIGCMSVFGYDPRKFYTGRGPLEATELGIKLDPKELAFRCNLVTTQGPLLKDFSADHISVGEAKELINSFSERIRAKYSRLVSFYPGKGTGYRNLMIYKNGDKDLEKISFAPPHDIMGEPYENYFPKQKKAKVLVDLMDLSREFFKKHPINLKRQSDGKGTASMIWLWGQGRSADFPSYFKRFRLHGAVITAVDLVKGIGIHAGLDVIKVPGVTGYFDTNYVGKAEYAINALRSRDFVAVHIESTDEAGHIGDPKLKVRAIEDVDRLVMGTLRKGLKEFKDYKVMVLPDHFTCVETKTHSSDAVPFLMYSTDEKHKGPVKFSERNCIEAKRTVTEGHRLIEKFINGGFPDKKAR